MINIIDMIDDLNEVEQDVLEKIDPDLISYTFSTRGGDQLIYLNKVYQIKRSYLLLLVHFEFNGVVKIVSIVGRLLDFFPYVRIF
jgi:hypothetical protein